MGQENTNRGIVLLIVMNLLFTSACIETGLQQAGQGALLTTPTTPSSPSDDGDGLPDTEVPEDGSQVEQDRVVTFMGVWNSSTVASSDNYVGYISTSPTNFQGISESSESRANDSQIQIIGDVIKLSLF